jgi:hypothetical protein
VFFDDIWFISYGFSGKTELFVGTARRKKQREIRGMEMLARTDLCCCFFGFDFDLRLMVEDVCPLLVFCYERVREPC